MLFSAISEALAILFFFSPGLIAPIPYGTFTFLFATLINFWVAIHLRRIVSETTDTALASLLDTLKNYFLFMGVFFFFDGIAHVGVPTLYPNPVVASHVHTFSHAFFFVGNAILIRIPLSFLNAGWKNIGSLVIGVIGVFVVMWRFLNTDQLVYVFGPNIPPIIITDKVSGLAFLVSNLIGLLIPGLYLMYLGIKSMDHIVRVRVLLLGLGMVVFFSVGPVIDLMKNQYLQLTIHLLVATSFFLMGGSALYRTGKERIENQVRAPSR